MKNELILSGVGITYYRIPLELIEIVIKDVRRDVKRESLTLTR